MVRKPTPFPRKPASKRPKKPNRGKQTYPALEFAKQFAMLTDEEIEACETGNADIKGSSLFNANADLSFPTGTWDKLYEGRRWDLLADRLLGLDQNQDEN